MQIGLFQNATDVRAHSAFGHEQGVGDHLGGASTRQIGKHFGLAPGEPVVLRERGVQLLLAVLVPDVLFRAVFGIPFRARCAVLGVRRIVGRNVEVTQDGGAFFQGRGEGGRVALAAQHVEQAEHHQHVQRSDGHAHDERARLAGNQRDQKADADADEAQQDGERPDDAAQHVARNREVVRSGCHQRPDDDVEHAVAGAHDDVERHGVLLPEKGQHGEQHHDHRHDDAVGHVQVDARARVQHEPRQRHRHHQVGYERRKVGLVHRSYREHGELPDEPEQARQHQAGDDEPQKRSERRHRPLRAAFAGRTAVGHFCAAAGQADEGGYGQGHHQEDGGHAQVFRQERHGQKQHSGQQEGHRQVERRARRVHASVAVCPAAPEVAIADAYQHGAAQQQRHHGHASDAS